MVEGAGDDPDAHIVGAERRRVDRTPPVRCRATRPGSRRPTGSSSDVHDGAVGLDGDAQRAYGAPIDAVDPQPQRPVERPRRAPSPVPCGSPGAARGCRSAAAAAPATGRAAPSPRRPRRRRRARRSGWARGATSQRPRRSTFITATIGPRQPPRPARATTWATARRRPPVGLDPQHVDREPLQPGPGRRAAERAQQVAADEPDRPLVAPLEVRRRGRRRWRRRRGRPARAPPRPSPRRGGSSSVDGRLGVHRSPDDTVGDDAPERPLGDLPRPLARRRRRAPRARPGGPGR